MTFSPDPQQVVTSVLDRLEKELGSRDRGGWLEERLELYAKFRGWLDPKTTPYEGASNVHIPLLESIGLRADAGLHNALMSQRPLLYAKAEQRGMTDQAERVTQVIDSEMWVQIPNAAERFGQFVTNYWLDGNVVAFTPWIREERQVTFTRRLPFPPPEVALEMYLFDSFDRLFASVLDKRQRSDTRFEVDFVRDDKTRVTATVTVKPFDTEKAAPDIEVEISYPLVVFDCPTFHVLDIEQVVFPTNCTNLQPPSQMNPKGAPCVFLLFDTTLDQIKRLKESRDYNTLTPEGLEAIEASLAPPPRDESLAQQRQEIEGTTPPATGTEYTLTGPLQGQKAVRIVVAFDRWEIDGKLEDVYFVVARDAKVLLEARLLTEKWPAALPYRPLAEATFVPVQGRWYGISLLKLAEAAYDLTRDLINLHIDTGISTASPPFFYSQSMAMRPGTFKYAPREGYPVPGDPRTAVYFPDIPASNQQWVMQLIGFIQQVNERATAFGDVQFGRVPPGRSAALRTFGSMSALMQQGDVRLDQILLRLLSGIKQIAMNFHRMNRHWLPEEREYRLWGWTPANKEPYALIRRAEIDIGVDFEFQSAFMKSNPAVRVGSLQSLMTVLATPLALQMGVTGPEQLHRLVTDFVKALGEDPDRYVTPTPETASPAITWEAAISMIFRNQLPVGTPLEGAQGHMEKANQFLQNDAQIGLLNPAQTELLRQWFGQVSTVAQREQLAQAAQQFQQTLAQAGGQQGPELQAGPQAAPGPPPEGTLNNEIRP